MQKKSVFIPHNSEDQIIVTKTDVLETIPKDSVEKPIINWKETNNKEWRWRFLKLPNRRFVIEISYTEAKSDERIFFNKNGKWVPRIVDPVYDNYVIKEYYWYN